MAFAGHAYAINAKKRRRKEAKERIAEANRIKLSEVFKRYDVSGTGSLSRDEVKKMLSELNGDTDPTEDELTFIIKVADKRPPAGELGVKEFVEARNAWTCYLSDFSDETCFGSQLFQKYDTDKSGKLSPEQLAKLLTEFNDNEEVSDIDVEWVLSKADVLGDGHVTKMELSLALGFWYQKRNQHAAEQKASQVCTIL
eukprot:gnl/MRDRNA2_/MRDRNA2_89656_c0_seq1.p1 gnl/MRDRNA2_/MRDRNA2_89656_c0~~gnl/MRDRNA2_/MRDRNA2_89656_c0_seq1.p1  ORF type:complete len:198 (+),score=54.30 gnl/MRDRNA2_/MRDRNA2_89656_c0_seq1:62-655(+)